MDVRSDLLFDPLIEERLALGRRVLRALLQSQSYRCAGLNRKTFPEAGMSDGGIYGFANLATGRQLRAGVAIDQSLATRILDQHMGWHSEGNLWGQLIRSPNYADIQTRDEARIWIRENCEVRLLTILQIESRFGRVDLEWLERFIEFALQPEFLGTRENVRGRGAGGFGDPR
jgi:hypothetical protein